MRAPAAPFRCDCARCADRRVQRRSAAIVTGFLAGIALCGAIEIVRALTGAAL